MDCYSPMPCPRCGGEQNLVIDVLDGTPDGQMFPALGTCFSCSAELHGWITAAQLRQNPVPWDDDHSSPPHSS